MLSEGEPDRIRREIEDGRMRALQVAIVGAAVLTNLLDGFDILSMSFVAPTLSRVWSLGPERLGFLLSSGLTGMVIGAIGLSWIVDVIGRRSAVILCLTLMAGGMFAASLAGSGGVLALCRVVTGLGVGGMNAASGSLVIEYSTTKRREAAVGAVVLGYPLGTLLGGLMSVWLLGHFGWRSVFVLGGLASTALVPVFALFVPESIQFLILRRPKGALMTINRTLARLQMAPLAALPPQVQSGSRLGVIDVFRPPQLKWTVPCSIAYFLFMMSQYFILSWAPKLMAQAGASDAGAISISLLINAGGICGGALVGLITARFGRRNTSVLMPILMSLFITGFGIIVPSAATGVLLFVGLGFSLFAATTCLFSVVAGGFPATVRGMGIGVATSAGRLGSVTGVYLAGVLLAFGFNRMALCATLSLPVLVTALLLSRLVPRGRHLHAVEVRDTPRTAA